MAWHLLFGIIMQEDSHAGQFLRDKGITESEILDNIPTYFPDADPPF